MLTSFIFILEKLAVLKKVTHSVFMILKKPVWNKIRYTYIYDCTEVRLRSNSLYLWMMYVHPYKSVAIFTNRNNFKTIRWKFQSQDSNTCGTITAFQNCKEVVLRKVNDWLDLVSTKHFSFSVHVLFYVNNLRGGKSSVKDYTHVST